MVGINHIAGGIAITATLCSFSDVNIFSKVEYLVVCLIGSLLSDIDHPKSILGRMILPISRWISKEYGHRTITHSFLFVITTTILVYFIEYFTISHITSIFFYAIMSHVILDMLTLQGVPFLYPFSKMIFVIPGDAKMRIQNKNMKSQATAFAVFSCFILLSYSLFQQGFWSTYNQSFSRIKHVHSEVKRSENLILCESDLGKGYVIESSNSKLVLYSDSLEDFITIKETDNYKYTTPIQTKKKLTIKEHLLIDISTDSLNKFLSSKLIKEMKITSKYKLSYFLHEQKEKKTIQEQYCKDLVFTEQEDTTKSVLLEQLKLKSIKLHEVQAKNEQIEQEYLQKKKEYKLLKVQYSSANLEEKEHIYKKLQKAKGVSEQDKGKIMTTAVLQEEIRYLKEQLTHTNKNQVTGIVKELLLND